ncbi:MAG: hypothetical protein QOD69_3174 [Solirubrobacteraceae bacterium]|jgi:hypothetical protein|nr:hypothetical protein [Solirubrobacteraceae bacterium]
MRTTATLAGALALLVLAGCGGGSSSSSPPRTTTIDPTRVEKAIEVSVAEQSHRMSIVVCPTGIRRAKGKSFNCVATLSQGDKYPFRVTQKDNRGNVHYEQATGDTKGTTKTP